MIAKVIVGLNRPEMDKCFDYRVPEGMQVCCGGRVIVPFGRRNSKTEGVILSLTEETELPPERIKEILEVLDEGKPSLTPELLALADWMQERYFCTKNQALQAILPTGIRTKSSWMIYKKEPTEEQKLTPKETQVLSYFGTETGLPLEELQEAFGDGCAEYLRKMEKKGLLEWRQTLHRREYRKERRWISLNRAYAFSEKEKKRLETNRQLEGQRRLLTYLQDGKEAMPEEIKERLNIGDSPIKTLLQKGILLERKETERRQVCDAAKVGRTEAFLPTAEQAEALAALRQEMEQENKRPVLLHGVTGSGKTELYLQIIAEVLAKGQQAIVLVPEIALTPLILERFLSRFGDRVSVTHSRLSMGERVDQWKKARDGEISVMIGPRSALFTPFPQVGAIIMDEAHENSYLSDITPKYDTKEVAEEAARQYGALLVMGTATPDIVSYHKAKTGEYLLLELRERAAGGVLPQVFITDMRKELAEGNRSAFSRDLQQAIRENLCSGGQTMLFLNRRGYATFVSCRSCGYVMTCPECDISYTYHAKAHGLVCHYCGRRVPLPKVCPACGSQYIRYFGTGTEKIEEEARKLFPSARILRMDLDTTMRKHSHEKILDAFGRGEADILIGTQMIAKGHDYPNVNLVGILAADTALYTNSYTAAETAFRLMIQAAGRAGRRDDKGKVFLQTYQPQHYAVQYAARQDYCGFYEEEAAIRRMMGYPPFASFFRILLTGETEKQVAEAAEELARCIRQADTGEEASVLGPTPAALPKFRGEYRYQLIVKAEKEAVLRQLVLPAAEQLRKGRKDTVRLQVTFNPTNIV